MRRHLFILSILTLIMGLYSQPGAAWQEPVKALSSDTVQSAVEPAVPSGAAVSASHSISVSPDSRHGATTQQEPPRDIAPKYIDVRHIRTYDFPQNEEYTDKPRKIFVLELETEDYWPPYSDILLDTNAGFGLMLGTLGSALANNLREVEIACYSRRPAPDDCSPEAIVIYNASAALNRYHEQNHERTDILNILRPNKDTYRQFETAEGLLPAPSKVTEKGKASKCPEILVAYEGANTVHSRNVGVRLTFPKGQKKNYENPTLITSQGYNASGAWYEESPLNDSYLLGLSTYNVETWDPEYVPGNSGKLGETGIFIREAYAWKKGKKVNILPCLVEDSFRMLPIRFSGRGDSGSLPGN